MGSSEGREFLGSAYQYDDGASTAKNTSKKSSRQDFIYNKRDKENFYKDLISFHENRNSPITRFPKINGRYVDLYGLYVEVVKRGGWLKVNLRNEWEELLSVLELTEKCVNLSVALKHIYERYLDKFEKLNYLGEDPDRTEEPEDEGRHKKYTSRSSYSVPMKYNYNQHSVSEQMRITNKLSNDLYKGSEYEKLLLSLMSPLPNEQDFAINVCTLMSNESKHTLKINHCPKLLDTLLAHAGVYCHFTVRELFDELYTNIRHHSLQTFWTDCLCEKKQILDLSYDDFLQSSNDKLPNEESLFRSELRSSHAERINQLETKASLKDYNLNFLALRRGLGTHDYIGQRVSQVISIIRNLSFFEENTKTMAKNKTLIRFLVMCANIRWGHIHHMALDIFGNIATELELFDPVFDNVTRCFLSTICEGLEGQDRGVIISCLEIISKLCQKDINEEHLHKCLDQKIYNQICLFLSLNDIMLLLYTLECIYALSSFGQKSCNILIQVKGIVDTLVSLITVEAQSYGPDGCILMRVVETVPGNMLPMVAQNIANLQNVAISGQMNVHQMHYGGQSDIPEPAKFTGNILNQAVAVPLNTRVVQQISMSQASKESNSLPTVQNNPKQNQQTENEQFALTWLAANFEITNSIENSIDQQELYKMYVAAMQKAGKRGYLTAINFPRTVRSVFGTIIGPNLIKIPDQSGVEINAFHYVYLRPKANSLLMHHKATITSSNSHTPVAVAAPSEPKIEKDIFIQIQKSNEHLLPARFKIEEIPKQKQVKNTQVQFQSVHNSQNDQTPQGSEAHLQRFIQVKATSQNQNMIQYQVTPQTVTPTSNKSVISQGRQRSVSLAQNQTKNQAITQPRSTSSSSLVKSLLANKVTTTVTEVTETNASAAPNNPSCLISQNINLHQVAQRQQKLKELANNQKQLQQKIQSNLFSTITSSLVTNTINALAGSSSVPPTNAVKVGQTTIKAITSNAVIPATVLEKKTTATTQINEESSEKSIWEPIPPFAPVNTTGSRPTLSFVATSQMACEDSNSIGNMLAASNVLNSTQVNATDEGDASLISFEGLLIPKSKSGSSSIAEDEASSKDSFSKQSQSVFNANQMLVDLLDKKSPDPPINVNSSMKRKLDDEFPIENERKKNGLDKYEDDEPMVAPSKNAANLYAEIAASILEDEDLQEEAVLEPQPLQIQSLPHLQVQPVIPGNQRINHTPIVQKAPETSKQVITMPLPVQRQIIMAPHQHQMLISSGTPGNQTGQSTQTTATIKTDAGLQTIPLILQKQIVAGGQQIIQPVIQQSHQPQTTQYMLATSPQGQAYLVAQQQPTQAVLLAQTPQQQGAPTKTIIILQQPGSAPQTVAQQQIITSPGGSQKLIMTTQQGQQMIVTQMPRTMHQHQLILNHPANNTPYNTSSPNVVISQSGGIIQQQQQQQHQQQHQIHIQQQTKSSGPKTKVKIQPQSQAPPPPPPPPPPQNANILHQIPIQLSHIPATLKVHTPHVQVQPPAGQVQATAKTQVTKSHQITQASLNNSLIPQHTQLVKKQMISNNTQQFLYNENSDKKETFVTTTSNTEPQQVTSQNTQTSINMSVQNAITSVTSQINQAVQSSSMSSVVPLSEYPIFMENKPSGDALPQSSTQTPQASISKPKPSVEVKNEEEPIDPSWLWICDWRNCPRKKFNSLNEVYRHACIMHCPDNLDPLAEIYCQWGPGPHLCDNISRKRFSLMTHILDRHCTVDSLKAAAQRRIVSGMPLITHGQPVTIIKNISSASTSSDSKDKDSPIHSASSTSPLNTAMQAIKRHVTDFINPKELMDENEGPVTKSIRLTSALILRNLVTHTSIAKRNIRYHEPHLAFVALSNVESSRTISQILYELNN